MKCKVDLELTKQKVHLNAPSFKSKTFIVGEGLFFILLNLPTFFLKPCIDVALLRSLEY